MRANLAGGYFPTHFLLAMNGKDDKTWQEATFYPYISMLNNVFPVKGVGDTICRFLHFPGYFFCYYAVAILSLVLVREI